PAGGGVVWEESGGAPEGGWRGGENVAAGGAGGVGWCGSEPLSGRSDEVFPPTPGNWCGWCDFRAQCPEGRDASALRRPWDGLADQDPAAPYFSQIVTVSRPYDTPKHPR